MSCLYFVKRNEAFFLFHYHHIHKILLAYLIQLNCRRLLMEISLNFNEKDGIFKKKQTHSRTHKYSFHWNQLRIIFCNSDKSSWNDIVMGEGGKKCNFHKIWCLTIQSIFTSHDPNVNYDILHIMISFTAVHIYSILLWIISILFFVTHSK